MGVVTTPVEIDPALGHALRALRENRGLSQEDLGITNPTWTTIVSILTALDASLTNLEAAITQAKR